MCEKGKGGRFVAEAFKRALEGFGGCIERVLSELSSKNVRVGQLEEDNAGLKRRVEVLVSALEAHGVAVVDLYAENVLSKVSDLEVS